MNVKTNITLETRKPRLDGKFPVKLRLTYKRERHYYTLRYPKNNESIYLTEKEFEKVMGERPQNDHKKTRLILNAHEEKAVNDIESLPVFTFEAFETKYYGKAVNGTDLLSCLRNKADKLRSEGRISTALSYECSISSFKRYTEKEHISFDKVSITFLNDFEKWMLSQGNSNTTIGMYLRNVRTAFGEAIRNGHIQSELYPFAKDKYVIPSSRNIKKALLHNQVGLISSYPCNEGTSEQRYRDYWMFSFLCNGINIKDMANLKYSNINSDVLTFVRAKTQREKRANQKPITLVISKDIGRIIDRWGNKPGLPDSYLFPILETGLNPTQKYARVNQVTKLINKYIARVTERVGITEKVTTYTARHSFATVLKRSGAPTEYISESLGHNSLATTENYLADFEIDEKRKWAEKLTQFNK